MILTQTNVAIIHTQLIRLEHATPDFVRLTLTTHQHRRRYERERERERGGGGRERERERGNFIKINRNNDTIMIQCMDYTD